MADIKAVFSGRAAAVPPRQAVLPLTALKPAPNLSKKYYGAVAISALCIVLIAVLATQYAPVHSFMNQSLNSSGSARVYHLFLAGGIASVLSLLGLGYGIAEKNEQATGKLKKDSILPNTLMDWEVVNINPQGNVVVKHKASGDIYGTFAGDEKNIIRKKFNLLFFTQMTTGILFRLPYKVIDLLSGGFVRRGHERAVREYQHLQFQDAHVAEGNPPRRYCGKTTRIIGRVLQELVTDIMKVATYPIALVALQLVTIFGIIAPYDGRKLYSDIELLYATGSETHDLKLGARKIPRHMMTNFSSPCMQSKATWDRRNMYMYFPDWDGRTIRSQILDIKNKINKNRPFFGDQGTEFLQYLEMFKGMLQLNDQDEIELRFNPYLYPHLFR